MRTRETRLEKDEDILVAFGRPFLGPRQGSPCAGKRGSAQRLGRGRAGRQRLGLLAVVGLLVLVVSSDCRRWVRRRQERKVGQRARGAEAFSRQVLRACLRIAAAHSLLGLFSGVGRRQRHGRDTEIHQRTVDRQNARQRDLGVIARRGRRAVLDLQLSCARMSGPGVLPTGQHGGRLAPDLQVDVLPDPSGVLPRPSTVPAAGRPHRQRPRRRLVICHFAGGCRDEGGCRFNSQRLLFQPPGTMWNVTVL